MSHAAGVLCIDHGWVMARADCPECDDRQRHGYTYAPCDDRCPENLGYDYRVHLDP